MKNKIILVSETSNDASISEPSSPPIPNFTNFDDFASYLDNNLTQTSSMCYNQLR